MHLSAPLRLDEERRDLGLDSRRIEEDPPVAQRAGLDRPGVTPLVADHDPAVGVEDQVVLDAEQGEIAVELDAMIVRRGARREDLDHDVQSKWLGWKRADMIRTGDRSYCVIGEWQDMAAMAAARPNMITTLNSFRDTLEDLGGGLGVTDPVSGPVVLEIR